MFWKPVFGNAGVVEWITGTDAVWLRGCCSLRQDSLASWPIGFDDPGAALVYVFYEF